MKTYKQRNDEKQQIVNTTEILRSFGPEQYEEIKPRLDERKKNGEKLVEMY